MKYDMEQWVDKNKGKIIEYQEIIEYKKPELYEEGEGWSFHFYGTGDHKYGILQDAMYLGEGKWLLGLNDIAKCGDYYVTKSIRYYPLNRMSIIIKEDNQSIIQQIKYIEDMSNYAQ